MFTSFFGSSEPPQTSHLVRFHVLYVIRRGAVQGSAFYE